MRAEKVTDFHCGRCDCVRDKGVAFTCFPVTSPYVRKVLLCDPCLLELVREAMSE